MEMEGGKGGKMFQLETTAYAKTQRQKKNIVCDLGEWKEMRQTGEMSQGPCMPR